MDVRIRRTDDTDAGSLPIVVLTAETEGAEIVQLPLEDTDFVSGVYFAESIVLAWDEYVDSENTYSTSDIEAPYILSTTFHFEQPAVSCRSDISVPTFEVVVDSLGGPE